MYESQADKTREAIRTIKKNVPPAWLAIVLILLFILVFFRPWTQVGPGQRGVVLNFGAVQKNVLDEGLHPRIPVMQEIVLVDVKVQRLRRRLRPPRKIFRMSLPGWP